MSHDIEKVAASLPISKEAQRIADEANQDAGFQSMIKFKKGLYYSEGEEVPLGHTYIAHAIGWTKCWIKFEGGQVADRRVYRVAAGEKAPERDQLPDNDQRHWPNGLDGRPADPWVYQYLLPLEDPITGEVRIFVGSSFGGRRAVADLCAAFGRRARTNPGSGQPVIKLDTTMMPTKRFGEVPRPLFVITGWDGESEQAPVQVDVEALKKAEFDDEIPF